MLLGFAAYLLFMRSQQTAAGSFQCTIEDNTYNITDEKAGLLFQYWQLNTTELSIKAILSEESIWGEDLTKIPRFYLDLVKMVLNIKLFNIAQICATLHA
jgi:tagaturonate reductase